MPTFRRFAFLLVFALVLGPVLAGCEEDEVALEGTPGTAEEATPPGGTDTQGGVTFTRIERAPALEGASARFTAPETTNGVASPVSIVAEVESFEAGVQTDVPRQDSLANSDRGQHLHVIVDNEPYMAYYTPGEPFDVGELEPGPHSLITFPSRSFHESVKNEGAMDYMNIVVGDSMVQDEAAYPFDPEAPTIIYSRPKGTYEGEAAENILLDFYLHNVQLSEGGYNARYTIRQVGQGGETMDMGSLVLEDWQPAIVEGLPSGEYVVELVLLDAEGTLVDGLFNQTERRITVRRTGDAMPGTAAQDTTAMGGE